MAPRFPCSARAGQFRRGRRHVGIGFRAARLAGLRRDRDRRRRRRCREAPHAGASGSGGRPFRGRGAGRRRARGAAVAAAGRHPASEPAAAGAARRRRRVGAQIARRTLFLLAKRRTRLARGLRRRTWRCAPGGAPGGLRIRRRALARRKASPPRGDRCRRRAARPHGRAGRLPIRPCARLLPAIAARG